jgi:DNA-binding transcriptional LysR family regulator
MDLAHIRTFVAVARAGNLSRAAERLHLSQPAASAHIKALEEEFKSSLFHRRAAGLELTQAGHRLLSRAEQLLLDADALLTDARKVSGEVAGRLRIGVLPDPDLIKLGEILRHLRATSSLIEIEVYQRYSHSSLEGVRSGELDACFALEADWDRSLSAIVLKECVYRVCSAANSAAKLMTCELKELAAAPWVLPPKNGAHGAMLDRMLRPASTELIPAVRVDSEAMIRAGVISGLGLGLVREDLALESAKARHLVFRKDIKVSAKLLFAFAAERRNEPTIVMLNEAVRSVWMRATARNHRVGKRVKR